MTNDIPGEEKLKEKLVRLCQHQSELEANRKAEMTSYAEQLKGCKLKINAIADALTHKDLSKLREAFDELEIDDLMRNH